MKNLIFIFLVIIFSCGSKARKSINKDDKVYQTNNFYQVYKLDSINSFYIVYLEKNKQKYKIVSEKKDNNKCEKIQIGQKYLFELTSILEQKIKLGDKEFSSSNSLMVNCYYFGKNTKICKEESEGIYDLFKTENLLGLCYVKPSN